MMTRAEFFEELLRGTTGNIELRRLVRNAQEKKYDVIERLFSRDVSELEKFSQNGGGDIFHGTNLRDDSGRGKKKNIREIICVTADIDFKTISKEEADEAIKNFPLEPTVKIASGNGYQPYWLLNAPLLANDETINLIEGIGKGIAKILGGDHTQDVTRVLRTPGRKNSKYADRICEIISADGPRYAIDDLKHFYVPVKSTNGPEVDIGDAQGDVPQRFKELLAKNRTIQNTWNGERPDLTDQSRSGYDMAMAHTLVSFDFTNLEVAVILRHMPSGKGADATRAYLTHTIAKAVDGRAEHHGSGERQAVSEIQNLTDLGNAKRFAALHVGTVLYSAERKKWIIWNEKFWEWDIHGKITDLAENVLKSMYQEAAAAKEKDLRAALAKHATKSEARRQIEAMLVLAQTQPGIRTSLDIFDRDPYLFNAANATIDLRSGEGRNFRREDYLTRISPTVYDPRAECPRFDAFMSAITLRRQDLSKFIQRAAGYSMTGATKEQCIFILHGPGGNGKSTLALTLAGVWGESYQQQIKAEILCQSKQDSTTDYHIAELHGMRVALACETELRRRLASALIKQWTGGEPLVGRRPYEMPIRFIPITKLWLSTNHLPKIDDTTTSIWRRIHVVPFEATFEDNGGQREKGYEERLLPEASGILNWMISGCLSWQQIELNPPPVVGEQTSRYREEEDVIHNFLQDKCVAGVEEWASFADLYAEYVSWCEAEGEAQQSATAFGRALTEKGYPADKFNGIRGRNGLRLRNLTD